VPFTPHHLNINTVIEMLEAQTLKLAKHNKDHLVCGSEIKYYHSVISTSQSVHSDMILQLHK